LQERYREAQPLFEEALGLRKQLLEKKYASSSLNNLEVAVSLDCLATGIMQFSVLIIRHFLLVMNTFL
jgi:hypothetical protein